MTYKGCNRWDFFSLSCVFSLWGGICAQSWYFGMNILKQMAYITTWSYVLQIVFKFQQWRHKQVVSIEAHDGLITNHLFSPTNLDTWTPSKSQEHMCSFDCELICLLFTKNTVTGENGCTHNHKRFDPTQAIQTKTIIYMSSLCLQLLVLNSQSE